MNNSERRSVLLACDDTMTLPLQQMAESLNRVCRTIRFAASPRPISLAGPTVSNPRSYEALSQRATELGKQHALILIATDLPYDNNFFWDASDGNVVILSFYGWSSLTNLAKTNGLVGFINSILAQSIGPSLQHNRNIGCVYDFLSDKRGIDTTLRAGVMCRECLAIVKDRAKERADEVLPLFDATIAEALPDLLAMLEEVSLASRQEVDIMNRLRTKAGVAQEFDVFLCHNSEDKPSVRKLYEGLCDRKLAPWFDEEHLQPGVPWQRELERTIPRIKTAAVVVGPHGQGPWQHIELDAFLREFANRGCPVIPVLLQNAGATPELPLFLRAFMWVDFRRRIPDPWVQLVWGVTGQKPSSLLTPPLDE